MLPSLQALSPPHSPTKKLLPTPPKGESSKHELQPEEVIKSKSQLPLERVSSEETSYQSLLSPTNEAKAEKPEGGMLPRNEPRNTVNVISELQLPLEKVESDKKMIYQSPTSPTDLKIKESVNELGGIVEPMTQLPLSPDETSSHADRGRTEQPKRAPPLDEMVKPEKAASKAETTHHWPPIQPAQHFTPVSPPSTPFLYPGTGVPNLEPVLQKLDSLGVYAEPSPPTIHALQTLKDDSSSSETEVRNLIPISMELESKENMGNITQKLGSSDEFIAGSGGSTASHESLPAYIRHAKSSAGSLGGTDSPDEAVITSLPDLDSQFKEDHG